MRRIFRSIIPWLLSAAFVFPSMTWSDELEVTDAGPAAAVTNQPDAIESIPASVDVDPELGGIVGEEALATARGGSDLHVNQNNLDAILEDNVASNLTTGDNTITEGAFTNTMGIPMVIQNSGNNVIIQNSTILNLELH